MRRPMAREHGAVPAAGQADWAAMGGGDAHGGANVALGSGAGEGRREKAQGARREAGFVCGRVGAAGSRAAARVTEGDVEAPKGAEHRVDSAASNAEGVRRRASEAARGERSGRSSMVRKPARGRRLGVGTTALRHGEHML
jgi:hypothetical protein